MNAKKLIIAAFCCVMLIATFAAGVAVGMKRGANSAKPIAGSAPSAPEVQVAATRPDPPVAPQIADVFRKLSDPRSGGINAILARELIQRIDTGGFAAGTAFADQLESYCGDRPEVAFAIRRNLADLGRSRGATVEELDVQFEKAWFLATRQWCDAVRDYIAVTEHYAGVISESKDRPEWKSARVYYRQVVDAYHAYLVIPANAYKHATYGPVQSRDLFVEASHLYDSSAVKLVGMLQPGEASRIPFANRAVHFLADRFDTDAGRAKLQQLCFAQDYFERWECNVLAYCHQLLDGKTELWRTNLNEPENRQVVEQFRDLVEKERAYRTQRLLDSAIPLGELWGIPDSDPDDTDSDRAQLRRFLEAVEKEQLQ